MIGPEQPPLSRSSRFTVAVYLHYESPLWLSFCHKSPRPRAAGFKSPSPQSRPPPLLIPAVVASRRRRRAALARPRAAIYAASAVAYSEPATDASEPPLASAVMACLALESLSYRTSKAPLPRRPTLPLPARAASEPVGATLSRRGHLESPGPEPTRTAPNRHRGSPVSSSAAPAPP